jgi:hypothetical protein
MTIDRMPAPPRLVVVPSADTAFADAVQTVMASNPWIDTSAELETALRQYFERARVTERVPAAEPEQTWYVYRDAPRGRA